MADTSLPTAIDLFSGAGGLTLGLALAKFRVLGAIEQDAIAAETYRLNHQDVHLIEDDIRSVDPVSFRRACGLNKGELDLLAGCPPCQGFTSLRTRNRSRSVDDLRNDLVFEFLRFAAEFEPRAIMMENVPNLASDERIGILLEGLRELGFFINDQSVRVLNAADFGVPQRRRRMILLATREGPANFAAPSKKRRTVRDAFEELPFIPQEGDPLHDYQQRRTERVREVIANIPKDGGSRSQLPDHLVLECHKQSNGFKDVFGRMAWDDVAPTITSGCTNPSKGRFLHPDLDRCITLREAALLQAFPGTYRFSTRKGRDAVAAMIGNALPPEFIRRIALPIRDHLAESADHD